MQTKSRIIPIRRWWLLAFVVALFGGVSSGVPQEQKPATAPIPEWQKLVVPDTDDLKELEAFIDSTKKRQPVTGEQYVEMQRSLRTASKRVVELVVDRKSPLFRKAESEFVNASVMLLGNEGPDAQRKTFERFRDYLKERPNIEFTDIQMALLAGQNLEQLADYQLAKEAYKTFAELFRDKKDPNLSEVIAMFESNGRRLDLPGKQFELKGTTISGEDFDIESLRGKFVLVYFWASISKPCELEHPYMLSVYNKYKSRGFEIVGIGLDEEKEVAQAFIQRLEVPWANLWESRKQGVSKVMETYGVSATPTSFLLDKDGKVITIEARGLLLGKALENLLPESPPEAQESKK